MTAKRPLDTSILRTMAIHIGGAAFEMAEGERRWIVDGDLLAGRASLQALRALIEFLVGRERSHKEQDIQPKDYCPNWAVADGDTELLRERLRFVDQSTAHLSLGRAETDEHWPERWHDTVGRVLSLAQRFCNEIDGHPAHQNLFTGLENARKALSEASRSSADLE